VSLVFPHTLIVALTVVAAGCGTQATPAPKEVVIWRNIGSWTGHGPAQTEAFIGETGALRLLWETKNEAASGQGIFRATVHSAVSGRPLVVAIDHHSIGRDTAYIQEDPRSFYLVVDSANVDWAITVEEAIAGTVSEPENIQKRTD
jgi:hypothetical protein